ncbi:MAG: YybH family protein [Planctomycetota bacterium]|jgi:ketosteroid isomerase-like protein
MSIAESRGRSRVAQLVSSSAGRLVRPITGIRFIASIAGALVFLLLIAAVAVTAQQDAASERQLREEAVWKAVDVRNATWRENDFEGHMAVYHSDFRRWTLHSPKLMTKPEFAALWNSIKRNEQVISLEVEPEEVVFYAGGDVAIAHDTIHETWKWIGDEKTNGEGRAVRKGDIQSGSLRFSDVFVDVDGNWRYVGGHRDRMALKE